MSPSKVDKAVVKAFRKRWLALRGKARNGTLQSYRLSLANWFEATSRKERLALARAYYGIAHIELMCALTDEQILANLAPVCRYLDAHSEDDECCPTAEDLVSSEYVLFSFPREDFPDYIEPDSVYLRVCSEGDADDGTEMNAVDPSQLDVDAYTSNSAYYDDWYEYVGGVYTSLLAVLMKSTGESFSKAEARMLTASVVQNVAPADHEELWVFGVAHHGNQMVVSIDTDSPSYYVFPIINAITEMSSDGLAAMVESILSIEGNAREDLPRDLLKAVDAFSKRRKPDTEALKQRLVRLMGRQKRNSDIRCFENALARYLFGGRQYYHQKDGVTVFF